MENTHEIINDKYRYSNYNLENDYQKKYDDDMVFRKIANSTKLPKSTLMKYTTKLELSSLELRNCKNCKNLMECKNEVCGYVYYPARNLDDIEFSYVPCKYKQELDKKNTYPSNVYYFDMPKDIKNASMSEIYTKDKNRYPVIKWIKEFLEKEKNMEDSKGLYLNGSFGCGKTYLLSAMLNELAKSGKKNLIILKKLICYF